jgi:hypothetical protein
MTLRFAAEMLCGGASAARAAMAARESTTNVCAARNHAVRLIAKADDNLTRFIRLDISGSRFGSTFGIAAGELVDSAKRNDSPDPASRFRCSRGNPGNNRR